MSRKPPRNRHRETNKLTDPNRIYPFLQREGEKAVGNAIVKFLGENAGQTFRSRDLASALGYDSEDDIFGFWHVLHTLNANGVIDKDDDRNYSLPDETEAAQRLAVHTAEQQRLADAPKFEVGGSYTGKLIVNASGFGFVVIEGYTEDAYIPNDQLGYYIDGDEVEVRIVRAPSEKTVQIPVRGGRKGKGNANTNRSERFEGALERLITRKRTELVGTLVRKNRAFLMTPDDARVPHQVAIKLKDALEATEGDKVVVGDLEFKEEFMLSGRVVQILGKAGDSSTEVLSIARSRGIDSTFPKEVVEEANLISETIPHEELARRVDYRQKTVFTIDPYDAKDFDDALSVEPFGKDEFLVGVHIADVSHYVREGTELDAESQRRATSTYLVDRVIPMLPSNLSEVICSLNPNTDRLAYSVLMRLDSAGEVLDYRVEKTVIHSKRRFTYEEVQTIIETKEGDFQEEIEMLFKLSKGLMKERFNEGAIDFDTDEVKFKLDSTGKPIEVIRKMRLDSHRLIEEFMLLANKLVARHIAKEFQSNGVSYPSVYRIHDSPDPSRIKNLAAFVGKLGYKLELGKNQLDNETASAKAMKKLLSEVKGTPVEFLVSEVALRTMAKAVYSERNIGHYGLGFDYYSHFTSPIRRYPDLITHRLLFEYETHRKAHEKLSEKRQKFLWGIVPAICKNSSEQERNATEAERESIKLKQVEYIADHVGNMYDGIISGVTQFGIYVKLDELLIEGLVHIKNIGDDYYEFDEKTYALVGERKKRRLQMGQRVKVQVQGTDPKRKTIDFILAPTVSAS